MAPRTIPFPNPLLGFGPPVVDTKDPAGSIKNPLSGIQSAVTDINGLATALTQRNTWLRAAEIVLGGVLLAIGIAAIVKATPVGSAIKSAQSTGQKTAMKAVKYVK